ncbi:hypothetical protein [Litorivicinus lipolyticus]|uniref:hypothetical protein n=1 Tax=Litorivicinus lipolyticus TaxID=418701 RepID=UPI003B59CC26
MPEANQKAIKDILSYMRHFASGMLTTSGRFYPCAVRYRGGQIEPIDALDQHSGTLIEYFQHQCSQMVETDDVEATALAVDVWLDEGHDQDGLQLTIWSKNLPSVELLMSWRRGENGIEYGKIKVLSSDSSKHGQP